MRVSSDGPLSVTPRSVSSAARTLESGQHTLASALGMTGMTEDAEFLKSDETKALILDRPRLLAQLKRILDLTLQNRAEMHSNRNVAILQDICMNT